MTKEPGPRGIFISERMFVQHPPAIVSNPVSSAASFKHLCSVSIAAEGMQCWLMVYLQSCGGAGS